MHNLAFTTECPPTYVDKFWEISGRFSSFGAITSLLLELCQTIFHTGRIVILDSGFCVLQALIKLRSLGVYASAVIKKRRCWPRYVKGDVIDSHINDTKEIGEVATIKGNMDGIKYNLFCMRDADYVLKLMCTYGTLDEDMNKETQRQLNDGTTKKFRHTETFKNHYLYRHAVDDYNNIRHSTPSIEGCWKTHRWAVRVFSFLLALSETNSFLAMRQFVWHSSTTSRKTPMTLLQFRKKLAMQLIENECWKEEV